MSGAPAGSYINALRWFKHISSFVAAETDKFAKADFDLVLAGGGNVGIGKGGGRECESPIGLLPVGPRQIN